MEEAIWIVLAILFILITLGVLFVVLTLKSKKRRPVDYYAFFIMGIIWIPFGIILENYVFSVMGLIFAIIGLVNKDKWKKNRITWDKLNEQEKKFRFIVIIILSVLVLAGLVAFILFSKGIIG